MGMPETQFARTADGASVAYQVWGDGPNFTWFPYLFGHVELEWEEPSHRRAFERLGSFARTVHFDKRGSGLSDPLDRAATLDDRMDDARAVLDALEMDRVFVGGMSEGGPLACLFAATYPERVDGLFLINTFGGPPAGMPDALWEDYRRGRLSRWDDILTQWGNPDSPFVDMFLPSRTDDEVVRAWTARFTRNAMRPAAVKLAVEQAGSINVFGILPTIQVPTLVIHVTGDRVIPFAAGQAVAEAIPGAGFEPFEGVDHAWWMGPLHEPILDRIEQFVTGTTRTSHFAERSLATVLFTDIVASTATATRVGDRDWRCMLDAHDDLVVDLLGHHHGRKVKSTGDGVLATFDSPGRAIECALSLRDRASTMGLQLRAGLHTGEIELRGDDIGGIAVHLAARVEACARPGDVLVSRTVKDLVVGSPFQFEDRGPHDLKGIDGTWELHAVV